MAEPEILEPRAALEALQLAGKLGERLVFDSSPPRQQTVAELFLLHGRPPPVPAESPLLASSAPPACPGANSGGDPQEACVACGSGAPQPARETAVATTSPSAAAVPSAAAAEPGMADKAARRLLYMLTCFNCQTPRLFARPEQLMSHIKSRHSEEHCLATLEWR